METKIRVLIADDHDVVRRGIAAMLDPKSDIDLVGEASGGMEAVDKYRALKPDVILMDLVMPDKSGIDAIREIKKEFPKAKILVLTSYSDVELVIPAIKSGALGYVLKSSRAGELLQAIRDIYRGDSPLHPHVARKLLYGETINSPRPEEILTKREIEVLKLVAQGSSNDEIAKKLCISYGTVRSHISNLLSKLELTNRAQAVIYALREGITSLYMDAED